MSRVYHWVYKEREAYSLGQGRVYRRQRMGAKWRCVWAGKWSWSGLSGGWYASEGVDHPVFQVLTKAGYLWPSGVGWDISKPGVGPHLGGITVT